MTYPGGGLPPDLRPELKKLPTTQEDLDTALRKAGLGGAVTAALDGLPPLRADVDKISKAPGPDVDETGYVPVAKLRNQWRQVGVALSGVTADWSLLDGVAAHSAKLEEVTGEMLRVVTTPRRPRRGSPSVGFEYEVPSVKVDGGMPPKTLLARWDHASQEDVRLEVDGDHVEFVTAPVTTRQAVERQLGTIRDALHRIGTHESVVFKVPDDVRSAEDGRVLHGAGHRVRVWHTGGQVTGRVQATAACQLRDVPDLILMHADGAGLGAFADDPDRVPAVAFAHLLNYYLVTLQGGGVATEQQGPKVVLPVMCRTSLHAMYANLSGADKAHVRKLIKYGKGSAGIRGERLVKGRYLGPAGHKETGPSVGEWLDSVVDGCPTTVDTEPLDRDNDGTGPRGDSYDLMSPPPGYPAHRTGRHFTYAMGYFGLADDGAALFEVREIWPAGAYGMDKFEAQALEFAGQRFESADDRRARLQLTVDGVVAKVRGGRSRPGNYARNVATRLKRSVPATEYPLACSLIDAALKKPPPASPPSRSSGSRKTGKKRGRDEHDGED